MGTLVIDRGAPSFENGVAHVWIETAAPADASAERLGKVRLDGITHRLGKAEKIPFAIAPGRAPAGNARLRAWIDVDGRGPAASGDLFSTEAVAVSGGPHVVRVENPAAGCAGGTNV